MLRTVRYVHSNKGSTKRKVSREKEKFEPDRNLPPEHPRDGSTDYVEGIVFIFHDLTSPIFDEPTFHDAFPKIILEYSKKCDPDLPNGA